MYYYNKVIFLTPYQRPWLYNGAPLVSFYDTLGIRRTYSRLKPRRPHEGGGIAACNVKHHHTHTRAFQLVLLTLGLKAQRSLFPQ